MSACILLQNLTCPCFPTLSWFPHNATKYSCLFESSAVPHCPGHPRPVTVLLQGTVDHTPKSSSDLRHPTPQVVAHQVSPMWHPTEWAKHELATKFWIPCKKPLPGQDSLPNICNYFNGARKKSTCKIEAWNHVA